MYFKTIHDNENIEQNIYKLSKPIFFSNLAFNFISFYTLNSLYLRDGTLGVEALSLDTVPMRRNSRHL